MFIFGLISIILPIIATYYGISNVVMYGISGAWIFISFYLAFSMAGDCEPATGYAEHYDIDSKFSVIPLSSAISMFLNFIIMAHFPFAYGLIIIFSLSFIGLISSVNYARNKVFSWNIKEYEEFNKPNKNLLKANVLCTAYNYIFATIPSFAILLIKFIKDKLENFDLKMFKSAKGDYE